MAKPHQRVFSLVIALIFLATTIAFSAAIVWQITRDSSSDPDISVQDQQLEQTQEGKLEGTKLEGFTPVAKVDKLEVKDIQEGTGDEVKPGATVKAHYTGALAKDGTIFQSSYDFGQDPIEFGLDQVIKGWTDGVPGMKVGGKRMLIIPAEQAYGAAERPGIPANSDLVFIIDLEGVTQ
ncbi:FKBP-type peptidyl-prolyl cis-trans isomerase [Candidatus Saccharibacteria bacterium]|nr:FKBP-type peptidyl-prolyl cis-trans isomerase [Candidatus Saccharibacteria bacterium]